MMMEMRLNKSDSPENEVIIQRLLQFRFTWTDHVAWEEEGDRIARKLARAMGKKRSSSISMSAPSHVTDREYGDEVGKLDLDPQALVKRCWSLNRILLALKQGYYEHESTTQ
jgi:hypothetical protein